MSEMALATMINKFIISVIALVDLNSSLTDLWLTTISELEAYVNCNIYDSRFNRCTFVSHSFSIKNIYTYKLYQLNLWPNARRKTQYFLALLAKLNWINDLTHMQCYSYMHGELSTYIWRKFIGIEKK